MLRYALLLLLVNTYGRSLGGPVPEQNSNGKILIGSLLNDLSKHCKNELVLYQLENKNNSCDVKLNYRVADLQCLMFYDANRLLCNLTVPSTADLATDFTAKISEKQNISAFCSEALHFAVPVTTYQKMITTVFQRDDGCKKVCADDDIRTGDTHFFCKYYKWALQKLEPPQSLLQAQSSTANSAGPVATGEDVQKNDAADIQASHSPDGESKVVSDAASSKVQTVKVEETNQLTSELGKQESSSTVHLVDPHIPENSNLPSNLDTAVKKITPKPLNDVGKKVEDAKQEQVPLVDPNDGVNDGGLDSNGGIKDPDAMQQIETPGQKIALENVNDDTDDTGMDMDEDGKESADDAEDQNGNDMDTKFGQEAKIPDGRLETQGSLNGEGSRSDFFQNAVVPNEGFTDDDHFFPFFLTVVIVVVVLYVLYHNKNKVGKMFFGLIVEGRQPGRRRSSRGHAYRRLDTLEQAMSANTAAPPSKIIY